MVETCVNNTHTNTIDSHKEPQQAKEPMTHHSCFYIDPALAMIMKLILIQQNVIIKQNVIMLHQSFKINVFQWMSLL
ncbi:hypothetical protein D3C80_2157330 [compost metagenome]